ncbi:MAG: CARDB domain-containing protein [Oscillospiraceae bacterium]|nr:CARDB domain-containing protein [Oscillospiraceae bacterium]
MKNKLVRAVASLLLVLSAALLVLPAAGAVGTAESYISSKASIARGDAVDILVSVKDDTLTTDKVNVKDIDVTRLSDSFSGGDIAVELSSTGAEPLAYSIKVTNLSYSGSGKALRLNAGIKGSAESYRPIELTINEAVEYTEPPQSEGTPSVIVTRSAIVKPVSAGETLDFILTVKNGGTAAMLSPVVSVTPSEALIVLNYTSTFVLADLAAGASTDIAIKVKATKEISSTNQTLTVDTKYSYHSKGELASGSSSDKISISSNPSGASTETGGGGGGGFGSAIDPSVPSVIISSYSFGSDTVAAGNRFKLDFGFKNTGKLRIENIVVTVDGGDSFTMDNSTNTFYYSELAAGAEQKQQAPMQVLAAAKSGAHSVGVSFKYEYVDSSKRGNVTTEIKLSVPVVQPDRFQLTAPVLPEASYVGEEMTVTMAYVNKGREDVYNVEASVVGEGVSTPAKTQYIGNITAGSSGSLGFAITPLNTGSTKLKLTVSYEDAAQKVTTKEFPITIEAQEPLPVQDTADEQGGSGGSAAGWIIGLVALAALGGGTALFIRRRRAKAAVPAAETTDWNSWDDDKPETGSGGGK